LGQQVHPQSECLNAEKKLKLSKTHSGVTSQEEWKNRIQNQGAWGGKTKSKLVSKKRPNPREYHGTVGWGNECERTINRGGKEWTAER